MSSRVRLSVQSLSLVCLVLLLPSHGARAEVTSSLDLAPCEAGLSQMPYPDTFRCGTLEVFENRSSREGRRIPLFVVVAPATSAEGASRPPLFFLNGGPGDANSPVAPFVASLLSKANRSRDLVFVDLRGTGRSNPLACERIGAETSLQRHMSYLLRVEIDVEPCVERLAETADLTQYTTTYAAADYNDVRAALGYDQMALIGGSYGTRLGLEILRRYPEHVDAAILFGVMPPSVAIPSGFARSFQNVLDGMFESCASDASCRRQFPDLAADFERVLTEVRANGASAEVLHPESQDRQRVHLTYGEFAMGLRFLAYSSQDVAMMPAQISAAASGDFEPLLQTIAQIFFSVHQRFFIGANNSFVCAEDLPFVDLESEEREAAGTVLGTYRMRQQLDTCAKWPRGEVPADFHDPVVSSVPVLLMTGEGDPVTPVENADRVARTLSRSLHAVFRGRGHSIVEDPAATDCFSKLVADILASSSLDGLDIGCASALTSR